MKIAIDARMYTYTGIGRYIQNLAMNLARLNISDSYTLISNATVDIPRLENLKLRISRRNIPVYSLKEHVFLQAEMNREGPDILHYPNFNMPFFNSKPVVATVHDLIYYLNPDACPNRGAHLYARVMFKRLAACARKIITVSEFTRREVIERLGADPGKVVVIHNGVDEMYRREEDPGALRKIRERYGIEGDYIFYAGNHQPRKNLMRLVKAFSILKNRGYQLVMTGKIDTRRPELYKTVKDLGLEGSVRFIGMAPEADLPALYSMAAVFAFPSLSEGFGLPPLEAMACGAPVAASNATSIPEVVGDAAVTFDPMDIGSIAEKLDMVLSSEALRKEMREKGLKRAGLFSWKESARMTSEVYREVLGR